jgi:hypothetical protein
LIVSVPLYTHLPGHQAQVNSPYHTKKTSYQQSLFHGDNGEIEDRHKGPKLEAGGHDGPKLLMTSDVSHCGELSHTSAYMHAVEQ